ncbi:hypothetical protein BURMUCF1_B0278 [Burkholderia multivorans ATCC BAA-247]|nr:hypothetical protein BURMUCF1_B0278 [Burkholderia multivorans ATCC BAA-247]
MRAHRRRRAEGSEPGTCETPLTKHLNIGERIERLATRSVHFGFRFSFFVRVFDRAQRH